MTDPEPRHLSPLRPPDGGAWVDDEFLWDVLPRLTPTAAYVYLALLRYPTRAAYPAAGDLAEELARPAVFVTRALAELVRAGLLSPGDVRAVTDPKDPPTK